ncbi:uncharacterized protein LOC123447215 [Hordeum vulgare subsp. vulgare]|uniref:Uncharacterized protein n=1 Tax=Hordeum vulgare subsp. vulgare TaxID=112509 RepID=A0A8I6XPS3_HORVV|nr:uncharacterized protein LOC123447215 [Hordeum vulgare subsp. vulgare]
MEHARNGGLKVSCEEQELFGRRPNGTLPASIGLTGRAVDSGPATARVPLPPESAPSRQGTCADGELDVFSAERYFKGAMDGHHQEGPATPTRVEAVAAGARPAVPVSEPAWTRVSSASAGSVGSANSQAVLLRDARRRPRYHCMKCCLQVGVLLRLCSGKRAVRVDGAAAVATETAGSSKLAAPGGEIEWYKDLRREKAGLGSGITGDGHRGVVAGLRPNLNLEAAGVAAVGREEKGAEYTSASCSRGSFTLPAPVKVGCGRGGDDGDGGSESSSDLFEIKSLMIDDCPHEPSEASIQWSVVTASAGGGCPGAPAAVTQNMDRPVTLLTECLSRRPVDV